MVLPRAARKAQPRIHDNNMEALPPSAHELKVSCHMQSVQACHAPSIQEEMHIELLSPDDVVTYVYLYWIRVPQPRECSRMSVTHYLQRRANEGEPNSNPWSSEVFTYMHVYWIPDSGPTTKECVCVFPAGMVGNPIQAWDFSWKGARPHFTQKHISMWHQRMWGLRIQ